MKKRQFIIQVLVVGLIFGLFLFLRFYNFDKVIGFEWDQEQFSTQIKNIVVNHKLTLLGPRVVSDTGFFLAPYFSYILIPFYLLTKLHPWALIYFLVFFNLLFFFTGFFLIKKIFSFYHAVGFFLLWSASSYMSLYDVGAWWPVTIPLGVILTWFCLYKIYKKSIKAWPILGLILGFFANMHFQFVFIIFFAGLFLFYLFLTEKKVKINFKHIFSALFTFLLCFAPLALFDLRHDFLNIKLFFNFFFSKQAHVGHDSNVWLMVFSNFIQYFIYSNSNFTGLLFFIFFLFILIFLAAKKRGYYRIFYLSTLTLWLVFPICFALYGKRPSEYYFIFSMPFIVISLVDFFSSLKKRHLLIVYFVFFFFFNIKATMKNLQTNLIGLYYKDKAIQKLEELTRNKKFNVTLDTPPGLNSGYQYLFDYYQIKQSNNWKDPLFEIRVPPKKNDIEIGGIGIKIPKEYK